MPNQKANHSLSQALRARRKALGLSQAQVCDLAGVGLAFLYDLENGKETVRLDKVLVVLEVLGLGLVLRQEKQPLVVEDLPSGGIQ